MNIQLRLKNSDNPRAPLADGTIYDGAFGARFVIWNGTNGTYVKWDKVPCQPYTMNGKEYKERNAVQMEMSIRKDCEGLILQEFTRQIGAKNSTQRETPAQSSASAPPPNDDLPFT
jgi:hypothetical protein